MPTVKTPVQRSTLVSETSILATIEAEIFDSEPKFSSAMTTTNNNLTRIGSQTTFMLSSIMTRNVSHSSTAKYQSSNSPNYILLYIFIILLLILICTTIIACLFYFFFYYPRKRKYELNSKPTDFSKLFSPRFTDTFTDPAF